MSYTIGGLTVYQCKANFSDSSNQFAISLNKNDMVKVLDKQDHGTRIHSSSITWLAKTWVAIMPPVLLVSSCLIPPILCNLMGCYSCTDKTHWSM